jgi:RHS repeat-associated protein
MEASGLVVENNRTMPYGEEWLPAIASSNEQAFTTYQRGAESAVDYAINRYMAARYGSFLSIDPEAAGVRSSRPQSWNAYRYTNNDPLNLVDPDGRVACSTGQLYGMEDVEPGTPLGDFIESDSDLSIFAQTIFMEARVAYDIVAAVEKAAIASAGGVNKAYYEERIGSFGSNNTFYGVRKPTVPRKVDGAVTPRVLIML